MNKHERAGAVFPGEQKSCIHFEHIRLPPSQISNNNQRYRSEKFLSPITAANEEEDYLKEGGMSKSRWLEVAHSWCRLMSMRTEKR
ncbi:hypothetical protein CEXT_674421 [Caerostris extrusa]|uniref:Ycf15 n=1 Tax=Caerostris extrusa TaxID=172846 RepID=A0AAV4S3L5_CAEEX|nr:hypothetical protein CEXT_674421 [Caerostris extrusa]